MAKKKPSRKKRIPQTSDVKAARQALIQADLLGLEANRAELASVSKGAFGALRLRAGGSGYSRYRIGKPRADKGSGYKSIGKPPRQPRGGSTRRKKPTTRTAPRKTTPRKTTPRKTTPRKTTKRKPVTPIKPKPRTTPQNPRGEIRF